MLPHGPWMSASEVPADQVAELVDPYAALVCASSVKLAGVGRAVVQLDSDGETSSTRGRAGDPGDLRPVEVRLVCVDLEGDAGAVRGDARRPVADDEGLLRL